MNKLFEDIWEGRLGDMNDLYDRNDLDDESIEDSDSMNHDVPTNMEDVIAKAIKSARKESGLNQYYFAKQLDFSVSELSKLERGIANPKIRTIQSIADKIGLNVKIEFSPKNDEGVR